MLHSTPDVPTGARSLAANSSGAEINPFDSMGDYSLFKFETKDSIPFDSGKTGYDYGDFSGERVNDSEFHTICSDPNALFDEDERNHQDTEALSNIVYASMTDWTINTTENVNRSILSNVMGVSDPEDKGELRISWYFGCKSGNLGQLNPQPDCPRPQFDDSREIRSPEQIPPIAILKGRSMPFSDPSLKSTGSDATFTVPPQEERPIAQDSFFELNTSLREESLKLKRELVGEDSFEESVTRKELNKLVIKPTTIEEYGRQGSLSESVFSDSTIDLSYGRLDRSRLQRKMEETLYQEGLDATQVDASKSVVSRIINGIESGRISLAEMTGIQISDLAVNLASESKSDTALIIKLLFSLQESEKRRKRAEMKSRTDQPKLKRNANTSDSSSKRSLKQGARHSVSSDGKSTEQAFEKTKEIGEPQIASFGTISKNENIRMSDFNDSGPLVSSKSTPTSNMLSVSGQDQEGPLLGVLPGNSKSLKADTVTRESHSQQRSSSSLRSEIEVSMEFVPDRKAALATTLTSERSQPFLRDCGVQCNFSSGDESTSAAPLREKSYERVEQENSKARIKSDAVTQSDEQYVSHGFVGSLTSRQKNWSLASLVNSYPKEEDTIIASSLEPRLHFNVLTVAGTPHSYMNSTTVAGTNPTIYSPSQFTDVNQVNGRDVMTTVSCDVLVGVKSSVTTMGDNGFSKIGFHGSACEKIKDVSVVNNDLRRCFNPENSTQNSSPHMHYIDGSQNESLNDSISLSQAPSLLDSGERTSLDFVPTHDRTQPPATPFEDCEKAVATGRPLDNRIFSSVGVVNDPLDNNPKPTRKSSKSSGVIYVGDRQAKRAESKQFEGPSDTTAEFGYQTLPIQGNSRQGKEIENLVKTSIAQAKMTSLLPSVIVDSELLFSAIQCVGITSHQLLALHNAGSRWMHCRLKCDQYAVNRSKMDSSETCAFTFQDRLILPPHTTEKIKVKFAPKHPGLYVCKIAVESSPAVPSADNQDQQCDGTQIVHVEGFAELPCVEILQEDSQIDFGEISYGTSKTRPIRLVTKSQAAVPIRMIISGSATVWPCFQFVNCDSSPRGSPTSRLQRPGAMTSPPMLSFTLPGKSEQGGHSDPSVVWVQFRAPHKEDNKGTKGKLGPPEEFTARVDVEVHGKGTDLIIGSVLLKALVGQAKLYGAKDLKAVTLSTTENQRVSRSIELLNAGNISMHVDLKFQSDDGLFAVLPDKVVLRPSQKTEVFLHFESPRPTVVDTYLLLFLPPHGPCHELQVRGMAAPKKKEGDYRQTLLCDKPVLCWAGVQLGQSKQQTLTLRNNSHHHDLHLCLSIQGSHSDFQIQNAFGNHTKDEGLLKIAIKPQEDFVLYILFIPSCFGRISSALIVRSTEGGSKYLIPLHGHGGTSQVVPSLVRKSEEGYWYSIEKMVSGKSHIVRIVLKNVGVKDAFIKAVCYTDLQHLRRYPESLVSLPDDFVLPEKASKDVVVVIQPTSEVLRRPLEETSPTLYLVIYSGDEWLRQLYKRKLPESVGAYPKISSGRLMSLSFTSPFSGEDGSFEDVEYPDLPDWESFFQSCVHQTVIAIVENGSRGNKQDGVDIRTQTPKLLVQDLMPVTPAAKLLSANETKSTGRISKPQRSWLVTPDHITLTASQSFPEKRAAKVHVVNHTKEALSFKFFWPGEVLEVTPNEEEIPPKSQLAIVINIKHSFMVEKKRLPWQGSLYVRVGAEQKIIIAQIREDIAVEISPYGGLRKTTEKFNHFVSSRTPSPESEQTDAVKIFSVMPTLLHFKGTAIKSEKEDRILMQNNSDCAVKWLLASVAPTYLKANFNSGDIFRVTYSAFRFERLSGKLKPGEGTQVKVAFRPWDEGLYSQYWDVRISSEDGHVISKIRLQLDGECPSQEKNLLLGSTSHKQVGRAQPIVKESPETAIQDRPSSENLSRKSSSNQLSVAKTDKYQGLFVKEDHIVFEPTNKGCEEKAEFRLCNNTDKIQRARLSGVRAPFYLKHFKVAVKPKSFVRVPVFFAPTDATNSFESLLVISTEIGENLCVKLSGKLNASGGWT